MHGCLVIFWIGAEINSPPRTSTLFSRGTLTLEVTNFCTNKSTLLVCVASHDTCDVDGLVVTVDSLCGLLIWKEMME